MNDLSNVSNVLLVILFADETTLTSSHTNYNNVGKIVNIELVKLRKSLIRNGFTLNLGKTYAIIFSSTNVDINNNQLKFDKALINIEWKGKYLGVLTENKPSFKDHIYNIY